MPRDATSRARNNRDLRARDRGWGANRVQAAPQAATMLPSGAAYRSGFCTEKDKAERHVAYVVGATVAVDAMQLPTTCARCSASDEPDLASADADPFERQVGFAALQRGLDDALYRRPSLPMVRRGRRFESGRGVSTKGAARHGLLSPASPSALAAGRRGDSPEDSQGRRTGTGLHGLGRASHRPPGVRSDPGRREARRPAGGCGPPG